MPQDDLLTQDLIEKLDAIQLFLHPYGKVDVWGVYQLVEEFLYLSEENNRKIK